VSLERRELTSRHGHKVLMLIGDAGAVTLEAWLRPWQVAGVAGEQPAGILGIHGTPAESELTSSRQCEFLPGGRCIPDTAWAAGRDLAPDVLAGYDSRAWVEMHAWYISRIDSQG
jgi:hypothetical protein